MKKKLVAVLTATMMSAVLLTACGSNAEDAATDEITVEESVEEVTEEVADAE